jgi:two-component system sensor histidine kinase KdpD
VGLRLPEEERGGAGPLGAETDRTLAALLDQAAVALERAQLMEESARSAARAETEQLRAALLTSLGHDLRTPLTSIRGALETLRGAGGALPEATRHDLLDAATEETERLGRYIANILDIVRIENGQVEPRRELVDLEEAIDSAVARAERAEPGRTIRRDIATGLPQARLDPALLDQILRNLLDNAQKFSGPAGAVTVRARRDGHELAISVEDDGPGIPEAHLSRIFDPFFRASRSDRVAAGTGLGLAICRGLAAAMGGRIAAESPVSTEGRGARVTVWFPG